MNWAHVHLIINHFPVVGIFLVLLLFAVAVLRKSDELLRVSVAGLVFLGLVTVPVYLTGHGAEDVIEHIPGVSENLIETHEEVASLALVVFSASGLFALGGLIFFRHSPKMPLWFLAAAAAGALAAAGVVGITANLGGQIRHPEIHEANSAPADIEPGRQREHWHDR